MVITQLTHWEDRMWPYRVFQATRKGLTQEKKIHKSHTQYRDPSCPWEINYKNALKKFILGSFWNTLSLTSKTPKLCLCFPWHLVLEHHLFTNDWISLYKLHSRYGPKRNQDEMLQPRATGKQEHSADTYMSALRKCPGRNSNTHGIFSDSTVIQ